MGEQGVINHARSAARWASRAWSITPLLLF